MQKTLVNAEKANDDGLMDRPTDIAGSRVVCTHNKIYQMVWALHDLHSEYARQITPLK